MVAPSVAVAVRPRPAQSTAALVWRRLRRNRGALAGLGILALFTASALLAPWLAPYDPYASDLLGSLAGPSREHWLGTDELGRDILSRVIYGARISMVIGTISVAIGVALGVPVGLTAGYLGGRFDLLSQRVIDVLLGFPGIILAIVLVTVLGVGLVNVMIAVGIVSVPTYARLIRGQVLSLKTLEYVEAARALGAGQSRIILRHLLPNTLAVLVVQSTLQVASAILSAAALGFLGLGVQQPTAEWGAMLSTARQYIQLAPHTLIFPGLAIFLTVMAFNLLGDGLRDALDPRMTL
ncbi:MAG: ABC transporter permease [Armatimonadota bacterium]|nr:ABC transporter permease [Armatimonadota bacterium]MDR7451173.1 ABC transporter permease [Armatimonadota bacterium]MDR7467222.1 ABC transporter permease [Armatimonadota bacterium]MDR7494850.1 ABC transporter permease [Armatimonadota bacterium]MDR7500257.1 ABC transporter permease [Armatimonadota bacterium]